MGVSVCVNPPDLQDVLRREIPAAAVLGVSVHQSFPNIVLEAPLAQNRNGLGIAFAGSLNTVLVLSGWLTLYSHLCDRGRWPTRIVLQDSAIHYLAPVPGDFLATCEAPEPAEWDRILRVLARNRPARVSLAAHLAPRDNPGVVAARFTGRYVVGG